MIKTIKNLVIGCIISAILGGGIAMFQDRTPHNVSYNCGHCEKCHGDYKLDYKCGSTYVFRCEDCGHSVQTHT